MATWYKALFEALLSIWEDNAHHLCSTSVSDAACNALVNVAGKCAQAFAALIQVTKHHSNKQVSAKLCGYECIHMANLYPHVGKPFGSDIFACLP